MNADQYWNTEGVRLLSQDGGIPSVEERVKAAFNAGQKSERESSQAKNGIDETK